MTQQNPHIEQSTTQPYRYFVSYSWGGGMGSLEALLAQPVSGWADIDAFTTLAVESMRRHHPFVQTSQVVIVGFHLLSGPSGNGAAEQALRDLLNMVDQFDTPRDPGRVQAFVGDVRQVALRGLGQRRG